MKFKATKLSERSVNNNKSVKKMHLKKLGWQFVFSYLPFLITFVTYYMENENVKIEDCISIFISTPTMLMELIWFPLTLSFLNWLDREFYDRINYIKSNAVTKKSIIKVLLFIAFVVLIVVAFICKGINISQSKYSLTFYVILGITLFVISISIMNQIKLAKGAE